MKYKVLFIIFFFISLNLYSASITRTGQSPSGNLINTGSSVSISAHVETVVGEWAYIKYTVNNWASYEFIPLTGHGTYPDYTNSIPAQPAGTTVEYGLIINADDTPGPPDEQKAYDFNNGNNYVYSVTGGANNPPTITLNSPTGGETWAGIKNIIWTASDTDNDTIKIQIKYYHSGIYTTIASNINNTGNYNWNTTVVADDNDYRIKIIASDGHTNISTESGVFTVTNGSGNQPPVITVTGPNGGETLSGSQNITWVASDSDGDAVTLSIYYSSDGGNNWVSISSGEANDGSYTWDTTGVNNGDNYLIKIVADDSKITSYDTSDSTFSIANGMANSAPNIIVVSPNGAEVLVDTVQIRWSATDPDNDSVSCSIYYSSDSGVSWVNIVNNLPAGTTSYSWDTKTMLDGTDYLIKVIGSDGLLSGSDVSDKTFSINNSGTTGETSVELSPEVINSSIGDTNIIVDVIINNVQDLFGGNININYNNSLLQLISITEGNFLNQHHSTAFYTYTDTGILNFGVSYLGWTNGASGTGILAKLKFKALNNGTANLTFSDEKIKNSYLAEISHTTKSSRIIIGTVENNPPTVELIYPNNYDVLSGTQNILWSADDIDRDTLNISILYSSNNQNWINLFSNISNTGSYLWDTISIPNGSPYYLKIIASDGKATAYDVSASPFAIANSSNVVSEQPKIVSINPTNNSYIDTTTPIEIKFSKPMLIDSLDNNFILLNNQTSKTVKGVFKWKDSNKTMNYIVDLDWNSEYKGIIKTGYFQGPRDSASGMLLLAPENSIKTVYDKFEWIFHTINPANAEGYVESSDKKVNVSIPKDTFTHNVKVLISKSIKYGKAPSNNKIVPDSTYDITLMEDSNDNGIIDDNDTTITNQFGSDKYVQVTIKYNDNDQDGIVDNTGIDETTLKICRLNEKTFQWDIVQDKGVNEVDISKNEVTAYVRHFSSYSITGNSAELNDINKILIYPNPIKVDEDNSLKFKKIPLNSEIYIYDIAGHLIKKLSINYNNNDAIWYLKDKDENEVNTGIYFVVIKNNDKKRVEKVGVIR